MFGNKCNTLAYVLRERGIRESWNIIESPCKERARIEYSERKLCSIRGGTE